MLLHMSAEIAAIPAARVVAPAWVWLMLCGAAAIATVTDLRAMRIPNWLTLPLLAAGIAYAAITGGWEGARAALGGAALAGGLFVFAYMMAGGGAGDAKLMLALGSWLDYRQSLVLVLAVAVCGFVWAMVVVARRSGVRDIPTYLLGGLGLSYFQFRSAMSGRAFHVGGRAAAAGPGDKPVRRPKHWYPYAPAILAGTAATWFWLSHVGYVR
jgi:Flp pilus assembly protein protease CpaA